MTTIVIRADRLLIDSSSELIPQGAVVVQDKLIIYSGPWSEVKEKLTGNEKIKDLGQSTLMPGLFDCNVHTSSSTQTILTLYISDTSLTRPIQWNQLHHFTEIPRRWTHVRAYVSSRAETPRRGSNYSSRPRIKRNSSHDASR